MTDPNSDAPTNAETATETTVITATELATHLVCPRQYEFTFERPLSPREGSRDRVRARRRDLLRRPIIAGLRADARSETERIDTALEQFDQRWRLSRESYLAGEQERYDEEAVGAAIEAYFSNGGHGHAERLVDADATLGYERDGIRYEAAVDAVVERDQGYLAIRYVPDLTGILHVSWSDSHVRDFLDGRKYYPRQIGSFVRAGVAIRGLKAEFGIDLPCDFAYVAPLAESRPAYEFEPGPESPSGSGVHVDIARRHFEGAYEEERWDLVELIADRAAAIRAGETDPRERRFDEITATACEYCAYRDACPDYLAAELSFGDRPRSRPQSRVSGNADDTTEHGRKQDTTDAPTGDD
ncbi:hypothetical protein [Natrialba asiatica]|uniref:PD-(D/E)XK endonuclease-like domain-containing protein n=1 Tax=Natrialba asiatica (strain ATCC 700177 / DSM 12278 / JCM 9576 / FERM P-10747 / NBRC 102637 / 172P1) TaxID=29540 RepID=M0AN10_NATA1|nr:hypothetical protein [Natrialba asiatica]ELZ00096.1 hypothetical protein C481_13909 [Natrialba asiatica DSM 12278]